MFVTFVPMWNVIFGEFLLIWPPVCMYVSIWRLSFGIRIKYFMRFNFKWIFCSLLAIHDEFVIPFFSSTTSSAFYYFSFTFIWLRMNIRRCIDVEHFLFIGSNDIEMFGIFVNFPNVSKCSVNTCFFYAWVLTWQIKSICAKDVFVCVCDVWAGFFFGRHFSIEI